MNTELGLQLSELTGGGRGDAGKDSSMLSKLNSTSTNSVKSTSCEKHPNTWSARDTPFGVVPTPTIKGVRRQNDANPNPKA